MKLCGLVDQTWRKIIETHQQASVDVVPTSEFTETEVPAVGWDQALQEVDGGGVGCYCYEGRKSN